MANKCGAKTRKGTPCNKAAGYGTDHLGTGKCKYHGGKSTGPKKHGMFARFMPDDLKPLMQELEQKEIPSILREAISGQLLAIARAQKIMGVRDEQDDTVEISGENTKTYYARDKYANFLIAQSRAMDSLAKMIKTLKEIENQGEDDGSLADLVAAIRESDNQ